MIRNNHYARRTGQTAVTRNVSVWTVNLFFVGPQVKRFIVRVGEQQKHDKYDAVGQHWGVKELESSLICVHSSQSNTGATVDYAAHQNDLPDIVHIKPFS